MASYLKDPDEVLDYSMDWSARLPAGDTVESAVWTLPTGITQPSGKSSQLAGSVTTVWLEGGTAGSDYRVSCRVTTVADRVFERSIIIMVRNR